MKYLSILLLVFNLSQAQYKVQGSFTDSISKIKNVALYKLVQGNSKYLKYSEVNNNSFSFSMDSLSSGSYRALYKNVKTGYVDFIYNKENVTFKVNSKKGQPSTSFSKSRENQLLQAYNFNIATLQSKLDSVQMAFFRKPSSDIIKYKEILSKIKGAQAYYENLAKKDYCLSIIKASKRYNAMVPFTLPGNYITHIKNHFFDYINFNDQALVNSTFLKSRVNDYIFYLHQSNDKKTQETLYKKAIDDVLIQIENPELKESLLTFLITKLLKKELKNVVHYTLDKYKQLPLKYQKPEVLTNFYQRTKTLIGATAPDIKISKNSSLHTLTGKENYLVVFWSSTCSHCAIELPRLKKYLEKHTKVSVLTVGIEKEEDQQKWNKSVKNYPHWKHVISLGKWESKCALDYNINATPSFFLLDKNKKIIAKPDTLKELKTLL